MVKNHQKSLSQPERTFWREVFVARISLSSKMVFSIEQEVSEAADFADRAVIAYRQRVMWGKP